MSLNRVWHQGHIYTFSGEAGRERGGVRRGINTSLAILNFNLPLIIRHSSCKQRTMHNVIFKSSETLGTSPTIYHCQLTYTVARTCMIANQPYEQRFPHRAEREGNLCLAGYTMLHIMNKSVKQSQT